MKLSYTEPLLHRAIQLCGNEEDAKDLIQDTFLRILQKDPQDVKNPNGYVYNSLRNMYLEQKRRNAGITRKPKHEFIYEETINAPQESLMDDMMVDEFGRLHSTTQDVVVLRNNGYTHKEIARLLNREECTVKSLYSRAIKQLKNNLKTS